jgi:cell division protein FtsX
MAEKDGKWWHPLWKFAVHGVLGSAIFVLIAIPAVSLSVLVKWLQSREIDAYLIYGLKSAEYLVFAVDLILFAWFVIRTAIRAGRDL